MLWFVLLLLAPHDQNLNDPFFAYTDDVTFAPAVNAVQCAALLAIATAIHPLYFHRGRGVARQRRWLVPATVACAGGALLAGLYSHYRATFGPYSQPVLERLLRTVYADRVAPSMAPVALFGAVLVPYALGAQQLSVVGGCDVRPLVDVDRLGLQQHSVLLAGGWLVQYALVYALPQLARQLGLGHLLWFGALNASLAVYGLRWWLRAASGARTGGDESEEGTVTTTMEVETV